MLVNVARRLGSPARGTRRLTTIAFVGPGMGRFEKTGTIFVGSAGVRTIRLATNGRMMSMCGGGGGGGGAGMLLRNFTDGRSPGRRVSLLTTIARGMNVPAAGGLSFGGLFSSSARGGLPRAATGRFTTIGVGYLPGYVAPPPPWGGFVD